MVKRQFADKPTAKLHTGQLTLDNSQAGWLAE